MNEYSWTSAEWESLGKTLEQLEREGWEIIAICPLGGSQFCRIVHRRRKKGTD